MVVWFLSIAIAGALHIRDDPTVLTAINPFYGIDFLVHHGAIGLVTLGAVFLVVTGGEALYADLGHFGRKPIQTAWLGLVLPSLLINYFGQGAKVLADPAAIENPFYRLVPETFLLPMVVLATAATVIASQAVITGAYSLVHQAIQLGLLPRLAILHTSASHVGQIYIPRVTVSLMIGVLLLVGLFRTSSALASAYGIAVATTMVVDGILAFVVIWRGWQWPLWKTLLLIAPFVVVDVVFFSANFLKLFEGAWAPLLFGATMPAALHFLGFNPNSNDQKELEKAAELLTKIRPSVRKFHSSEYLNALASGEICLVVGWSGDIKQSQRRAIETKNGVEIGYSIPKEGAQMFFDNLAIPKDASHAPDAHVFINYLLRPEVAAKNSNLVAYANGNLASQKFLDKAVLDDKSVYPDAITMNRLYTVSARDQKSQRFVNRLWTKIKTGR